MASFLLAIMMIEQLTMPSYAYKIESQPSYVWEAYGKGSLEIVVAEFVDFREGSEWQADWCLIRHNSGLISLFLEHTDTDALSQLRKDDKFWVIRGRNEVEIADFGGKGKPVAAVLSGYSIVYQAWGFNAKDYLEGEGRGKFLVSGLTRS